MEDHRFPAPLAPTPARSKMLSFLALPPALPFPSGSAPPRLARPLAWTDRLSLPPPKDEEGKVNLGDESEADEGDEAEEKDVEEVDLERREG
jgi:hypothetical protein